MQHWHWAAVAGLAFVMGIGVGYGVSATTDDERPQISGGEDATGLESGNPDVDPQRRDDAPATGKPEEAPTEFGDDEEASEDSLMSALKSVPLPAPDTGDGKITGRVIDEKGDPVAGVKVQLSPYLAIQQRSLSLYDLSGREFYEGLEEDIRKLARIRALYSGGERSVVSDTDGQWSFEGIGEMTYHVRVKDRRFGVLASGDLTDLSAGDQVRISVTRFVELPIRMVLPNGEATTEVLPGIMPVGGTDRRHAMYSSHTGSWTHPEGKVFRPALPPGGYLISVNTSKYKTEGAKLVNVSEDGAETIELRLIEVPRIEGNLSWEGGAPKSSVRIRYRKLEPGESADDAKNDLMQQAGVYPRDGTYTITDAEPGRYALGVYAGEHLVAFELVNFGGGVQKFDLTLDVPGPAHSIDCIVEVPPGFEGGFPEFRMGFADKRPGFALTAWKVDGGRFRILPPPEEGTADSKPNSILIRVNGIGAVRVPISHTGSQTIRAVFRRPGALVLETNDWRGPKGFHQAPSIELTDEQGRRVGSTSIESGSPRPSVLRQIQPGTYHLRATWSKLVLLEESVTITSGHVVRRLDLPSFYTLTLVGGDQRLYTSIQAETRFGRINENVRIGGDMKTRELWLPPGEYRLGGALDRTINLQSDMTIRVGE